VISSGLTLDGEIRLLSLKNLFVAHEESLDGLGTRAEVEVTIPLHKESALVRLQCDVTSLGPHPRLNVTGLALSITEVCEGVKRGVFERYVKYLYYKMLTR